MSWTKINTTGEALTIAQAEHIHRTHRPVRQGLRTICTTCQNPWGTYGCPLTTWAVHILSRMSKIVVPNPPPRPKHRHRPAYVQLLTEGTRQARNLHTTPQPLTPR